MSEHEDASVEALFARYLARTEAGEEIAFDDWVAAYPAFDRELREVHAGWELLGSVRRRAELGFSESGDVDADWPSATDDADFQSVVREKLRRGPTHTGRYSVRGEIAHGGQGSVLRVWDEDLHRSLAMKVILGSGEAERTGDTPRVDSKTLRRFLEEAHVTAQLDHPGIVPIHELGLDGRGRVYFTMKLVKGQTLTEIIRLVLTGKSEWTVSRALRIIQRVCEAMSYAHSKGVVHRDLKPANIMVGRFGEVFVMDWGLARILSEEDKKDLRIRPEADAERGVDADSREAGANSPLITMDGDVVGTPAYMSPEQARGELDRIGRHSDVYAVGAMLYHLLSGQMPYVPRGERPSSFEVWRQVKLGPPEPLSELAPGTPAALLAICDKAMNRSWQRRYRSMSQLSTDLAAFLDDRVVRAYERGSWAELKTWCRRNRHLSVALVAAVVFMIAGLVVSSVALRREARAASLAEDRLRDVRRHEQNAIQSKQLALEERSAALESAEHARQSEARALELTAQAEEAAAAAARSARSASAAERTARHQSYYAYLTSAQISLFAGDGGTARQRLDECEEELRDWEWKNLWLLCDCSWAENLLTGETWISSYRRTETRTVDPMRPLTHPAREPIALRRVIWDRSSSDGITVLPHRGPSDPVAMAQSPDETRLGVADEAGGVWILDALSGESMLRIDVSVAAVRALAFDPVSGAVLVFSSDGFLRSFDASAGFLLRETALLGESVALVSIGSGGRRAAVGLADGRVFLTDRDPAIETRLLGRHPEGLSALALPGSEGHVLSLSKRGIVGEWGTGRSTPIAQSTGARALAVDGEWARIALAATDVEVLDRAAARAVSRMERVKGDVTTLAFSRSGRRLAAGTSDGSTVVWDVQSGQGLFAVRGHRAAVLQVAFWSDGARLATLSREGILVLETEPRAERERRHRRRTAARIEAAAVVDRMLDAGLGKDQVLEHLRGDVIVDAAAREQALERAQQALYEPADWARAALTIVLAAEASALQRESALRMAERASNAVPESADYRVTLGGALYRLERHEGALEHLRAAARAEPDHLLGQAFLALTYVQVGQRSFARNAVVRLRRMVAEPERLSPEARAVLREVEHATERSVL